MIWVIVFVLAVVFAIIFTFYEKSEQSKCSHNYKTTKSKDYIYKDFNQNLLIKRRIDKKCSKCGLLDYEINSFSGDEAKILQRESKFKELENDF